MDMKVTLSTSRSPLPLHRAPAQESEDGAGGSEMRPKLTEVPSAALPQPAQELVRTPTCQLAAQAPPGSALPEPWSVVENSFASA